MSKIKDACYAVGGIGSVYLACILWELLDKKDAIKPTEVGELAGVCVVGGIMAVKGLWGLAKDKKGNDK